MGGFAVQGQRLDGAVRGQHDGAAGGFVAAPRLHAHVTVLDDVETADAVVAAQLVELAEDLGGAQAFAVDGDDVALLIGQGHVGGLVRRRFRADAPAPHVFLRFPPRIFQVAALVGDVQQVGVHGVRGFLLLAGEVHRDLVVLAELHQLLAGVQVPLAPGRDHLDARGQRVGAQLEAHLIVALAGGAVGDGVGAGLGGDLHQALGDQRPGDGGAEQVLALVDGVGAEHREHIVAHELFAQVLDVDFLHAHRLGLGAGRFHFLALTDISGEGDHFAVVGFLQPLDDHGGIQATGIGQHHLVDIRHASLQELAIRKARIVPAPVRRRHLSQGAVIG